MQSIHSWTLVLPRDVSKRTSTAKFSEFLSILRDIFLKYSEYVECNTRNQYYGWILFRP